jgi:putative ABC transport system ATP-binding protein
MMVTHSQAAAAIADRILILSDGALHPASQAQTLSGAEYGAQPAARSVDDAR